MMSPLSGKTKKYNLLILVSHPIQYQTPLYKLLSKEPEIDLTVLFCSDWGLKTYKDKGFGKEVKWDIPLLDGYKYKFLKNVSPFPNVSTFFGLINPEIVNELKKSDYDAIWLHGWNSFTNWLAMVTAFYLNIPVLLRGETNLLQKPTFLKNLTKELVLKNLFKNISVFLAIGKYNADFYKSFGMPEEKIFLVPYTVNNDFFVSKAQELISKKKELRKKYNVPEESPVVLFSGKLIDKKRPFDLLKAFEIISKDIRTSLVFVGDGNLRNKLETYAKNNHIQNVFFIGFRNQTELPEFYAMADIFVLPSDFEPWGLVVNEAMCFGLPVIVSNKVGAGGDLVKNGENGFIYKAGNVIMLTSYLKDLLQDETKRIKFGQSSKGLIQEWSYKEDISGILCAISSMESK